MNFVCLLPLLLQFPLSEAHTDSPMRGFVYSSWSSDGFASNASDATLLEIPSLGVKVIEIMWTEYVDNSVNATTVHATPNTPTDAALRHAVASAHAAGLQVAFKPHVDCLDGVWRANIGTHYTTAAQWAAWWQSYTAYMLRAAALARDVGGVVGFNVGTELDGTHSHETEWRALIAQVRAALPGVPLWLGPNWSWQGVPGYTLVKFFDALDFIGVDMYAPLSPTDNPTLEAAVAGWGPIVANLSAFVAAHGDLGVIFAEIGYASYTHAATNAPGCCNGPPDPATQAILYESFFQAVWPQPWMAGVFWWAWPSDAPSGDPCGTSFDVWRKPAAAVLQRGYSSAGPSLLGSAAVTAPLVVHSSAVFAAPFVVYADGVTSWSDWSYGASVNLRDTSAPWPSHTYAAAAAVAHDGAVVLSSAADVPLASFSALRVDLRTSDAAHGAYISAFLCVCTDCTSCPVHLPQVLVVAYAAQGQCALPGGWSRVTIPLGDLAPDYSGAIKRVQFGSSGAPAGVNVTFAFDNLEFV